MDLMGCDVCACCLTDCIPVGQTLWSEVTKALAMVKIVRPLLSAAQKEVLEQLQG